MENPASFSFARAKLTQKAAQMIFTIWISSIYPSA